MAVFALYLTKRCLARCDANQGGRRTDRRLEAPDPTLDLETRIGLPVFGTRCRTGLLLGIFRWSYLPR